MLSDVSRTKLVSEISTVFAFSNRKAKIIKFHIKFCRNRLAGSREEDFLKGFYHIWALDHLGHVTQSAVNKLFSPLPKEAPHKIWL